MHDTESPRVEGTGSHHSELPSDRRALLAGIGGLAAGVLIAGSKNAHAGPLNPPAGPVLSTGKALTDVEPRTAINATNTPGGPNSLFRISQPGSYYLTGNVTGVAGKHGIEITASGVTVDLNGFDLVGVGNEGGSSGVHVSASGLVNIEVRNGSVRDWANQGVDLGASNTPGCRIERIRAFGNRGIGIRGSTGSIISECIANSSGASGIAAVSGGHISKCTASFNALFGIFTGTGSMVSECTVSTNGDDGIIADIGSTITACSARNNTGHGILVGNNSTVSNCTAAFNRANGIDASSGCTVSGCTASVNTLNGISGAADCFIVGNCCQSNGNGGNGAGIVVTASDNRIEGNNCLDSTRGIDVDTAGNIIIKNTCSGNSVNWDIAAGNALAPIVQAATNAVAISGNTYPGNLGAGSSDPNANFTY